MVPLNYRMDKTPHFPSVLLSRCRIVKINMPKRLYESFEYYL